MTSIFTLVARAKVDYRCDEMRHRISNLNRQAFENRINALLACRQRYSYFPSQYSFPCSQEEERFVSFIYPAFRDFLDAYIARLTKKGMKFDGSFDGDDLIQVAMDKAIPAIYDESHTFYEPWDLANYLKVCVYNDFLSRQTKEFRKRYLSTLDLAELMADEDLDDSWIEDIYPGLRRVFDSYHDELAKKALILFYENDNMMETVRDFIQLGYISTTPDDQCSDIKDCPEERKAKKAKYSCNTLTDCRNFYNFCRSKARSLTTRIECLKSFVMEHYGQQDRPDSELVSR